MIAQGGAFFIFCGPLYTHYNCSLSYGYTSPSRHRTSVAFSIVSVYFRNSYYLEFVR